MLDVFSRGIWVCEGPEVSVLGFAYPTRMTVIRLSGSRLVIHSPVPLSQELRDEIDLLGTVWQIIAPNHFHHLFLTPWIEAYPEASLLVVPKLTKKRPDLQPDTVLWAAEEDLWGGELRAQPIHGHAVLQELAFFHPESKTLILTDLVQQFPKDWFSGWRRLIARLDHMTDDEPAVPSKFRMLFLNRKKARTAIRTLVELKPETVTMSHGQPVTQFGTLYLQRAFRWLGV